MPWLPMPLSRNPSALHHSVSRCCLFAEYIKAWTSNAASPSDVHCFICAMQSKEVEAGLTEREVVRSSSWSSIDLYDCYRSAEHPLQRLVQYTICETLRRES